MTEQTFFWIMSYIIGTGSGFFIASLLTKDNCNRLLDHLVNEGFLRHRTDDNGNVVILKWHDSRQ